VVSTVAGFLAIAGVHALVYIPSVALASFLLLAFPDVPAFSCAAVDLAVAGAPTSVDGPEVVLGSYVCCCYLSCFVDTSWSRKDSCC
jgi:hypothetical protein